MDTGLACRVAHSLRKYIGDNKRHSVINFLGIIAIISTVLLLRLEGEDNLDKDLWSEDKDKNKDFKSNDKDL